MERVAFRLDRQHAASAAVTLAVHLGLGAALLWGLGMPLPRFVEEPLTTFDVRPPPPEPEIERPRPPPRVESDVDTRRFAPGEEGGASAPNLHSRATEIAAPERRIPLPVPSPVVAAETPLTGADATTGSAPVRGPGTGSGGEGDGTGSGLGGGGGGGGGYGRPRGPLTPPRHLSGRLRYTDLPPAVERSGSGGTVSVRYTVLTSGRVANCRITRSSGQPELDATTCRLIEARFRFDPSRDGRGRPIVSDIVENHSWVIETLPPEPEPPRRRRRF